MHEIGDLTDVRVPAVVDARHMIIEVRIDGRSPIEGSARGGDEAIHAFAGWLELLSVLSALLEAKPAEDER